MSINVPHLAFPPTIVDGKFQTVEQGSDEEIVGSADAALLCPIGHRALLPGYGRPPVEHTRRTVDRGALLADAVRTSEPRIIEVLTDEEIEDRAATIGVKVGRG